MVQFCSWLCERCGAEVNVLDEPGPNRPDVLVFCRPCLDADDLDDVVPRRFEERGVEMLPVIFAPLLETTPMVTP